MLSILVYRPQNCLQLSHPIISITVSWRSWNKPSCDRYKGCSSLWGSGLSRGYKPQIAPLTLHDCLDCKKVVPCTKTLYMCHYLQDVWDTRHRKALMRLLMGNRSLAVIQLSRADNNGTAWRVRLSTLPMTLNYQGNEYFGKVRISSASSVAIYVPSSIGEQLEWVAELEVEEWVWRLVWSQWLLARYWWEIYSFGLTYLERARLSFGSVVPRTMACSCHAGILLGSGVQIVDLSREYTSFLPSFLSRQWCVLYSSSNLLWLML
jgi:hypothetical protein